VSAIVLVDPEELTVVQWFGFVVVIVLAIFFICNWLNMVWF
jgi:hypothetical protein